MEHSLATGTKVAMHRDGVQALIEALAARTYKVLGPTVRTARSSMTRLRASPTCPRVD